MRKLVALRVLNEMLEGGELTDSDISDLIKLDGESLYIDFKDGAELQNPKKAALTVRMYVSGFANADGGLLVIGVSDGGVSDGSGMPKERTVTPTKRPGGKPLQEWARNVLESMAGSLAPAPRIQVVIVDGKEVLVIGVARAPALVPFIENGELKYYLRIGDATLEMAPYLISDLVLGRRIHPQLLVTTDKNGFGAMNGSTIQFRFIIENESMVPANDVILGVVSLAPHTTAPNQGRIASRTIRNYIDVAENNRDEGLSEPLDLIHITSRGKPPTMVNLPAFESVPIGGIGYLIVPDHPAPIPMRSALYVLASGHPPEWYQFDWVMPVTGQSSITISSLTRTYTERPMLAWNREWRQP